MISVKMAAERPMAHIRNRVQEGVSAPRAATADTLTAKQLWADFHGKAQHLYDSLDDMPQKRIDQMSLPKEDGSVHHLTTDGGVWLACLMQLEGVNLIAEALSPSFWSRISTRGSEEPFTHADLRVFGTPDAPGWQEPAQDQSQARASRASAVIKVKAISDFRIVRGDTWATICADPAKLKWVAPALQQVCLPVTDSRCMISHAPKRTRIRIDARL